MGFNIDKFKVFGESEPINCPQCKDLKRHTILKSSSALGVAGVSLYEYQIELFTICPSCGAVFAVDKEVAQYAGKGDSNKYSCISEPHLTYQTGLNYNAE